MPRSCALPGVVLLLAVACSPKPLPPDKASYAGTWEGPGMSLTIAPEGRLEYKRSKGSSTTQLKAPIQSFEGNDMVAGALGMSTRFVVSRPPHDAGGVWKMTVDGVELTRVLR